MKGQPKVKTVEIKTAAELVDNFLYNKQGSCYRGALYRGESSAKYKLIPSALRYENIYIIHSIADLSYRIRRSDKSNEWEYCDNENLQIQSEYALLREFFIKSDRNGLFLPNINRIRSKIFADGDLVFDINGETWLLPELEELAGLAQHYGMLTRLIDWSYDFFVALYFSVVGVLKKYESGQIDEKDFMVLWVLNADLIYMLSQKDHVVNGCSPNIPVSIVRPSYANNPNLAAQSGAFTYIKTPLPKMSGNFTVIDQPVNRTPFDEFILNLNLPPLSTLLVKFLLPVNQCFELMRLLQRLNYDAAKLFPGFGGVAKSMLERTMLLNNTSTIPDLKNFRSLYNDKDPLNNLF